jgi:hypothetical protein
MFVKLVNHRDCQVDVSHAGGSPPTDALIICVSHARAGERYRSMLGASVGILQLLPRINSTVMRAFSKILPFLDSRIVALHNPFKGTPRAQKAWLM